MTNTAKVHSRFWDAMRARFGKRWIDDQGDTPTAPWVQLINRYSPHDLRKALELMGEDAKRVHPPNLPEFEQYLRKASSRRVDYTDYVRAFWRSEVLAIALRQAAAFNLVAYGEQDLRALPPRAFSAAHDRCAAMLDWACQAERSNGQRTPYMSEHIARALIQALQPYRAVDPPTTREIVNVGTQDLALEHRA